MCFSYVMLVQALVRPEDDRVLTAKAQAPLSGVLMSSLLTYMRVASQNASVLRRPGSRVVETHPNTRNHPGWVWAGDLYLISQNVPSVSTPPINSGWDADIFLKDCRRGHFNWYAFTDLGHDFWLGFNDFIKLLSFKLRPPRASDWLISCLEVHVTT